MCAEPMFTPKELELLSVLVGDYLEIDDLNQIEWAEAKVISEKIEGLIN